MRWLAGVLGIVIACGAWAQGGQPFMAAYVASKAGLIGLTKSMALELGPLLVFFLTNGNCQRFFDYCVDEKQRLFAGTGMFMITTLIVPPELRPYSA